MPLRGHDDMLDTLSLTVGSGLFRDLALASPGREALAAYWRRALPQIQQFPVYSEPQATRSPNSIRGLRADLFIIDDVLPAEGLGKSPCTDLFTPTEKEPMNEIMTALEAMIRRIVREEIAKTPNITHDFSDLLKSFVGENTAEWAAIVSQGALDQPWFDGAVKVEVDSATEKLGAFKDGFAFSDEATFQSCVADAIADSSTVEDAITESVLGALRGQRFELVVR